MAYYKIIDGQRYDRSLLEKAEAHTKGRGEWQLSLDEIQDVFTAAGDGGAYTETEWHTLRYIAAHYPLTAPARKWLDEQFEAGNPAAEFGKIIEEVLRKQFGFASLQWQIDDAELQDQLSKPGNKTGVQAAVTGALNAFLSGGINVLSLRAVVQRRTGSGGGLSDDFYLKTTRKYMEDGGILFLIPEAESDRDQLEYDLPPSLNFENFWHFGLFVPALSPALFMASVSRKTPGFQYSIGYISRRVELDDLVRLVIVSLAQFPGLKRKIDAAEVTRQLDIAPDQNFGEALFGALFVGIFNGESSFSFRDFIGQEIWLDPDRDIRYYMRDYIETGTLHLLSPEGSADFPVPDNFAPDFQYDWAFGLEMPKKTDARFVITSSRNYGFEASWNDGFLPEMLDLEAQTNTVLEEFKLPGLQVTVPPDEFEAQRLQFGAEYRTFSSLLRQALNTILHDYLRPYSVFNIVAQVHRDDVNPDHFDDPFEYRAAIKHLIFNYLKTGSLEFLPIELPDNNPVEGESIQEFWQFFCLLPGLGDFGFWVIIPRFPDDGQLPYCYGVN
ncbi:MAG: hypothetical protein H6565_10615 [Lewinellaceae bacterium]|nr:hypothetical protein [Lewinellaceae bacterium]